MTAGWKFEPLGKVASLVGGGTPSKQTAAFWGGSIPWVSPKDMKYDIALDSEDHITPEAVEGSATKLIPAGAILIVVRSGILARTIPTAIAGRELTINQDLKAIVPSSKLDSHFLAYFLRASESYLLGKVTRGATVHKLDTDKITSLPVPLPPLEEQRRIVAILDEAFKGFSRARANAEANLQNARELFETQLNSEFELMGELGHSMQLDELIEISHGFAYKGEDFQVSEDSDLPIVLTPGNYTEEGRLSFTLKNTKRFTGKVNEQYRFHVGDLTVVMTDLSSKMKILGKPAFIECENVLHNQRIGRVIFKSDQIEPRLLFHFLRTQMAQYPIRETATGTMVRHTAPKRILGLRISFPPSKTDQLSHVNRIDAVEQRALELQEAYKRQLIKLESLRESILQKAFAGELTVREFA